MKKCAIIIFCILSLCSLFVACSDFNNSGFETELVKDCLNSYFSYYEKGDFDNMKQYCTNNFVDEYFHEKDVFGNASAKLIDFEEIKYDYETNQYIAILYVECVPVLNSALYDKNNPSKPVLTYISYILSIENGNVKIESLSTE